MRFVAGNAQHIGARKQQQDSFGFSDAGNKDFVAHGGFLGVVADGMGGLTKGHEASSVAVRAFLQAYERKAPSEAVPDALARAFGEANRAVVQLAAGASSSDAGTTLVAAVLHDNSLYWISAGDSRIYWLRGNQLTRVTADHVYATKLNREMVEGKISRAEAHTHPERASLTSYLGQPEPELVDRNRLPLPLHPEDCVILCSDGLYHALTESEMVGAFQNDLQQACDSLVHKVLSKQRKQQDNLTLIALKSSAHASSRQGLRSPLVVFIALLLVALSGGAGYWFGHRSKPANDATGQPLPSKSTPEPAVMVGKPAPPPAVLPAKPTESAAKKVPATAPPPAAETKDSKKKPKGEVTEAPPKKTPPTTQGSGQTPPTQGGAPPPPPNGTGGNASGTQPPAANQPPAGQQGSEQKKPDQPTTPPNPPDGGAPQKPDQAKPEGSQSAPNDQKQPDSSKPPDTSSPNLNAARLRVDSQLQDFYFLRTELPGETKGDEPCHS